MQKEIKKTEKLLDNNGNIANPGYAKKLFWEYNRENITASKLLIKEWDYYYIGNDSFGLALTIADMGYLGALSASFLDFENVTQVTKSSVILLPKGKLNMPKSSVVGDIDCANGKVKFKFTNDGKSRHLVGVYPKFGDNKEDLSFDIELSDTPEESMVIATPFSKNGRFYYNQKINCLTANGNFKIGKKEYKLSKENGALGTLDWGRGCWTYDNTWLWGSLQTVLPSGEKFGFNIGYGFGDTTNASENMLFFEGKSHKLDEVTFNIPQVDGKDDYMSKWTFTSNDDRFNMDFEPIIDRFAPVDVKVFCMIPHQVFGKFSGKAILDDGSVVKIKDCLGFAEKVHNKW